ncbi:MAG TPA: metallophosphoesterase [Gemmatimonadaceae bacterium]|nr:metallophosphoesterase [Gemmatimonadaceae bacterium]
MRLVHFSDLHLGFRQYQRQTPTGVNQREADVAVAFRKAIDKTIELQPDLVLIGGDVFHSVRPTNAAIVDAYKQFSRLVEMLPDSLIVMIAGNHDTPRTSETVCILGLFKRLGIHVVVNEPERLHFRDRDLSVFAIPHALAPRPRFDPQAGVRYNVLLLHDEVEGVIRRFGTIAEREAGELKLSDLGCDRWTYVGLGHYHVYHKYAPNAYYSGALEYTSTNIWGEADEAIEKQIGGKGLIEQDLDSGYHRFHQIALARPVLNLPELSGVGLSAADLGLAIQRAVDACDGGIDEKIVRLVVRDVPRHVLRDLDHKAIREFKRRALHFLLDARRPQQHRTEASGAPGRRTSLTEMVRATLEQRELTPGIDRAALVDLGLRYLAEADRAASMSIGVSG